MKNKIAIFYGGGFSERLDALVEAGKKIGVGVDVISYKEIYLDTEKGENGKLVVRLRSGKDLVDYGVVYFKIVKNYREEANLVVDAVGDGVKIVDSILKRGRPTDYCKIYQMKALTEAGLKIPKLIVGRLKYLRYEAVKKFNYPLILKGSQGDRRTQVFKFFSDESWDKDWDVLLEKEKREGQRYMVQEYLENTEDYRVMVLGDKVLGVMKRATGENERLKNVFTTTVLPDRVLDKAIKAALACGIEVAGVDLVFKKGEKDPYFWEVNRAPNYARFVEVTGVDVSLELIKYLASFLN